MEQLTIFEVMEKMKQPPRPDPADPLSLPGFAKVKAYLEGKGLPWEWIIADLIQAGKVVIMQ